MRTTTGIGLGAGAGRLHWAAWLRASVTVGLLAVAPAVASAAPLVAPFITYTIKGSGPTEEVVAFKAAEDLSRYALPDSAITNLSGAIVTNDTTRQQEAAFSTFMQAVGDLQGGLGALGTLAQHAAYIDALGDINTGLNNVGLALGAFQVYRDAIKGEKKAAVTGAVKTWVNFAVGRWGWSAAQIGSVAAFVVDITLREWQSGLLDIAHDVWWCRYTTYYRKDGKRTVNDWKVKVWELYQRSQRSQSTPFQKLLDDELDAFVHKAFSANLALFSDCSGPGSASSFGGAVKSVQDKLAAEHRATIEAMLVKQVFPEVADRIWRQNVGRQVDDLNLLRVPDLNQKLNLEVTAYDVTGPAKVAIPLPGGKRWTGKLKPDGTFQTQVTKWALVKAGLPDTIELETENGVETRPIAIVGNRIIAIFGTPKVSLISDYRWSEGPQHCITSGGTSGVVITDLPANDTSVHLAQLREGVFILGHYDAGAGTWTLASPGSTTAKGLAFGPPNLDHVQSLTGCDLGFLSGGGIAKGGCTVKRLEFKAVSARVTLKRYCESTVKLDLVGAYTTMAGKLQYFSFEGEQGKALRGVLGLSIEKGIEGGAAGLPNMVMPQGIK